MITAGENRVAAVAIGLLQVLQAHITAAVIQPLSDFVGPSGTRVDHDEAIKREHTEYIAAMIPHAGLLILPNTSHFAFLQDPRQFNFAILHFLGDE
jgi:pimeloyl-ACP methyl ester carboxylesterase